MALVAVLVAEVVVPDFLDDWGGPSDRDDGDSGVLVTVLASPVLGGGGGGDGDGGAVVVVAVVASSSDGGFAVAEGDASDDAVESSCA